MDNNKLARKNLDAALSSIKAEIELNRSWIDEEAVLLVTLRAALDAKPEPSWVKQVDGRMLYINPSYTREFGISPTQYAGQPDSEHWPAELAEQFKQNDERVAREGCAIVFKQTVIVNGKEVTHDILKWPIYLHGKLVAIGGESKGPSQ